MFIKTPVLRHFDPKCHIRIQTDALSYGIDGVLSQLILDNLGWWHPVAYFSKTIILAKTWHITHNAEFLALIKVFKTLRHY